jgi:hypothetical protein
MRVRLSKALLLWLVVASLGILACDLSTVGLAQASKPQITIQAPAPNAPFREGDEVGVQSLSSDSLGIVRVELSVDGAVVRADAPPIPQGQTSFLVVQKWKATPGTHTLSVRAFNANGGASEPAFVSITVSSGAVTELPTTLPLLPTVTIQSPLGTLPTVPPTGETAVPSVTRAPTRPPATPTVNAPPGVYATSIRVSPAAPKRNQPVSFTVTFLNTTGAPQSYRWRIIIYPPDSKNAKGDTATTDSTLAPGVTELTSPDNWTIRGPGPCEDYLARVFWLDENKQPNEFLKPDRSGGPAAGFQICP